MVPVTAELAIKYQEISYIAVIRQRGFREAKTLHSVKRRATQWTARVEFSAATRDFYLLYSIQTGCRTHPAFYPIETVRSLPGE
jgi:hypothetical protein